MSEISSPTRRVVLLGLAGLLLASGQASAQTGVRRRQVQRQRRRQQRRDRRQRLNRQDNEAVREAVRRGEILPLRSLMSYFEEQTGAEIIDVEYRYLRGQHLYGFKVRTPAGRLRWAVINAATREVMTRAEARRRYGN